jgi:hypothetical protein
VRLGHELARASAVRPPVYSTQSLLAAVHESVAGIEQLQNEASAPSVKQQLAAVQMMFNWLATGQVVPANPCSVQRPCAGQSMW